jgi:hypothetical protein
MTNDIERLRAVLLERASLAPDLDAVLPDTGLLSREQRRRRRTCGVVGAVAVTVLALVATGVLVRSGPSTRTTMAGPALVTEGAPLGAARFPVTVTVPPTYLMTSYSVDDADATLQYTRQGADKNGTDDIEIDWTYGDPSEEATGGVRTNVRGVTAVLGTVAGKPADRQLSWQLTATRWMAVAGSSKTVSVATLHTIAESVTTAPGPLPSSLRIAHMPPGWRPDSRTGASVVTTPEESALICKDAADGRPQTTTCLTVTLTASHTPPVGLATSNGPIRPGTLSVVGSQNNWQAVRLVDSDHWIVARSMATLTSMSPSASTSTSTSITPDLLLQFAASASVA